MKKWILALCLLLGSLGAVAQQSGRDIKIKVIDRRGNPVSNVIVQALSSDNAGATDAQGVYVLRSMQNGDSVKVLLPRIGEVLFPVQEGLNVVQLTVRSAREVEAVNETTKEEVHLGYGTNTRQRNTLPADVIDVEDLLKKTGANSITELLTGQVSGLEISMDMSGNAYVSIRGQGPALVVVDDIEYASFQDVENRFNVNQIKTITINKTGAGYGVKGAAGVVVFTTKR